MNVRFSPPIFAAVAAFALVGCGGSSSGGTQGSTHSLAEIDAAVSALDAKVARLEASQGKWVMWRMTMTPDSFQNFPPYLVEGAFSDKPSCVAAGQGQLEKLRQPRDVAVGELTYQATDAKGNRTIYGFLCVPDSVDPRLRK